MRCESNNVIPLVFQASGVAEHSALSTLALDTHNFSIYVFLVC